VLATLLSAVNAHGTGVEDTPANVDTAIRASQCYRLGDDRLAKCATSDLPGQDGQLGRDTYVGTRGAGDGVLGLSFARVCNSGDIGSPMLNDFVTAMAQVDTMV